MIRKTNNKRSTLTDHRFEVDAAFVLVHDNRPGDGQTLPCALSYLFGGKEGVKNLWSDLEGNTPTSVCNSKSRPLLNTGPFAP